MLFELTLEKNNINQKMFYNILAYWLLSRMITYYMYHCYICNYEYFFHENVFTFVYLSIKIIFFNKQFLFFVRHCGMEIHLCTNGSIIWFFFLEKWFKFWEVKRFLIFIEWNLNLKRSNFVIKTTWQKWTLNISSLLLF